MEAGLIKIYLLSHHDFYKQVAMTCIIPNIYWSTKMNGPELSMWGKIKGVVMASSLLVDGSILYVSKPNKIRTAKLDDNVLNPDGAMFVRLNITKDHLADKPKGHSWCLFSIWLVFETQRGITNCENFNVNLCKTCFKYFHVISDIASERRFLARKFNNEHAYMLRIERDFRNKIWIIN